MANRAPWQIDRPRHVGIGVGFGFQQDDLELASSGLVTAPPWFDGRDTRNEPVDVAIVEQDLKCPVFVDVRTLTAVLGFGALVACHDDVVDNRRGLHNWFGAANHDAVDAWPAVQWRSISARVVAWE
jgi:hypothetical protein